MSTNALEIFATTENDRDDRLPKSRGRCFDIGSWGGCGVSCPAFADGECGEPQEIDPNDVVDEHGKSEAINILEFYTCFDDFCENNQ